MTNLYIINIFYNIKIYFLGITKLFINYNVKIFFVYLINLNGFLKQCWNSVNLYLLY